MSNQTQSITDLYSGTGRYVMGDMSKKGEKDMDGKPIAPEDQEYFFGVAVPKTDQNIGNLWSTLNGLAQQHYGQHHGIMQQIQQGMNAPSFSWKVEDGDVAKIDSATGQSKKIPEYIAGHWILKFKTKYEFGACDMDQATRVLTEIDRAQIKRGDYIDVKFTAMPNGRLDHNAGIILYPNSVMRVGVGDAISGAVSASTAFADRAASAAPMGAPVGSLPQAGVAHGAPAAGVIPAGQTQPMQPTQPAAMPQAAPAAMGNPPTAGMMPAATGQPATAPGGTMPQPTPGGMPAASPAAATTSPTDPAAAGVQPHPGILAGPQTGGIPQG